jgi:Lar family restriction alleviation protein
MKDINPCPFCGKSDVIIMRGGCPEYDKCNNPEINFFQVRCEWCGSCGPEENQKGKAEKAWNERGKK